MFKTKGDEIDISRSTVNSHSIPTRIIAVHIGQVSQRIAITLAIPACLAMRLMPSTARPNVMTTTNARSASPIDKSRIASITPIKITTTRITLTD